MEGRGPLGVAEGGLYLAGEEAERPDSALRGLHGMGRGMGGRVELRVGVGRVMVVRDAERAELRERRGAG